MSRSDVTKALSIMLERYLDPHSDPRIYWAKEVTFDYATDHPIRVDYMSFKPVNNSISGIEKGDFYCYEIKSSVEDFKSKHGHNFIGDFNYYVMEESLFREIENLIPYNVGVLALTVRGLIVVKRPRRGNRTRPVSEMLLMMWRSSRRDLVKTIKEKQED